MAAAPWPKLCQLLAGQLLLRLAPVQQLTGSPPSEVSLEVRSVIGRRTSLSLFLSTPQDLDYGISFYLLKY